MERCGVIRFGGAGQRFGLVSWAWGWRGSGLERVRHGCDREMYGTEGLGRAGYCAESSVGDWKGSGSKDPVWLAKIGSGQASIGAGQHW